MAVLIKDVEMPTNCLECAFYRRKDTVYDYCCISSATPKGYVPDDCPLVPVPAHGDLIDRGALDVIGYCDIPQGYEDTFDSGVMWLAERIDELPTIIPASEEGE